MRTKVQIESAYIHADRIGGGGGEYESGLVSGGSTRKGGWGTDWVASTPRTRPHLWMGLRATQKRSVRQDHPTKTVRRNEKGRPPSSYVYICEMSSSM